MAETEPELTPFIVYALPRSRTAWLSAFLTYGKWSCHHERAIDMRSLADIRAFFAAPHTGSVETGAAQGWWIVNHCAPGIRSAVIRRPVDDVVRSVLDVDVSGVAVYDEAILRRNMEYGDRMLAQISDQPGVLTLDFDDLDTEEGCKRIFEFCLPYRFDRGWWNMMKGLNIQVDVRAFLLRYFRMRADVENFKRVCYRELRALRRAEAIRG